MIHFAEETPVNLLMQEFNQCYIVHRRPAEVLGHVHVAARTHPTEALWAMAEGGPMSLLPLSVSAVDKDTYEPVSRELYISSVTTLLAAPNFPHDICDCTASRDCGRTVPRTCT